MESNYEDIVYEWYNRLRPEFLRRLTLKYPALSLCEAENLYQDTFIAIQENLVKGTVQENTTWHSYILRIGLNLASKEIERKKRILTIDEKVDGDEDDEQPSATARKVEDLLKNCPDEEIPLCQNQEAQALLGKEIEHTPEPCCSIVRLYYYENMSMDEIAEDIGYKNASTVKAKKCQCMKDLIKRVKEVLHRAGITE